MNMYMNMYTLWDELQVEPEPNFQPAIHELGSHRPPSRTVMVTTQSLYFTIFIYVYIQGVCVNMATNRGPPHGALPVSIPDNRLQPHDA